MSAIEDWEAYLNEQKLIVGMPGLRPRPSFLVGWAAGYIAGQSGKPIAGASTPSAPAVDAGARDEVIAVASLLAGAVLNYPDFDDDEPTSAKPMLDIARRLEKAVCAALSASTEAAAGEPIYQTKLKRAQDWRDCDKETFDYYITHPHRVDTRIVYTAPPAASWQKLTELLADARDYVVAFEKDQTDGHIASSLVGKIDAVLVDFYADSATASDKGEHQ